MVGRHRSTHYPAPFLLHREQWVFGISGSWVGWSAAVGRFFARMPYVGEAMRTIILQVLKPDSDRGQIDGAG